MMKKVFVILMLMSVLLSFPTGCSRANHVVDVDWEQKIRADFYAGESAVEQAMADAVSVEIKQSNDQLLVAVTAPDICDNLLNWMDAVSDEEFTEASLEQEILRLLSECQKVKVEYILNFTLTGDSVAIDYTPHFGETMTCGLTRFYAEVTQRILDEMEDHAG